MKKSAKFLFALTLALVMALSACSGKNESGAAAGAGALAAGPDWGKMGYTSGGVAISDPGQFPIVKKFGDIKATILVTGHPAIIDWSTNEMSKWMERQTGIQIEYKTIPLEGRMEALNLELSSGNYPDAFMAVGITPELNARYGVGEGRLKALNDLIAVHAPNMTAIYQNNPGTEGQMTMLDGNVYCMPVINQCYHCTMFNKMWINTEFLKNTGKQMPTTTDELLDVLRAFRDQDANGNGDPNDEIPFTGAMMNGWGNAVEYFIMNSFTYYTADLLMNMTPGLAMGFYLDNGTVKTPWAEPALRDGLRFLNTLAKEGLLYEGAFSLDDVGMVNLVESSDSPRVGMVPAGYAGIFSELGGARYAMYAPMMPLAGPSGRRQTPRNTYDLNFNGFYVSAESQYAEAIVKWADKLYDFTATMNGYFGPEGTNWRPAQAGEIGLDGNPALYAVLKPWQEVEPQNEHWVQMSLSNRDAAFRAGESYDQSIPLHSGEGLEKLLFDTTKEMEVYANAESYMPPVKFTEDQANRNSVPMTDISNLVKQYIPGFITGAYSIDRDYDGFLQQLKNSGLDALTAAYQAAYDQQYK